MAQSTVNKHVKGICYENRNDRRDRAGIDS